MERNRTEVKEWQYRLRRIGRNYCVEMGDIWFNGNPIFPGAEWAENEMGDGG